MPGTILSTFYVLIYLILIMILWSSINILNCWFRGRNWGTNIALAKKFVRVFLYTVSEKLKWSFCSIQYLPKITYLVIEGVRILTHRIWWRKRKNLGGCYIWETEWMVLSLATIENIEEQVCGQFIGRLGVSRSNFGYHIKFEELLVGNPNEYTL